MARFALAGVLFFSVLSACSTLRPEKGEYGGIFDGAHPGKARETNGNQASENRSRSSNKKVQYAGDATTALAKKVSKDWQWPLSWVRITSPFGDRGEKFHEGVDLEAKRGTPVYSIGAGKVVFAGTQISGYGKMIVIQHEGGLFSVYAHNSEIRVDRGDAIKRGDLLALSGKTGHASGPHLHFEIRKGVLALDPVALLPTRVGSAKSRALAKIPEVRASSIKRN